MNVMMLGKPDKVENKPLKYTDHKYPEIDQGQVIVKVMPMECATATCT